MIADNGLEINRLEEMVTNRYMPRNWIVIRGIVFAANHKYIGMAYFQEKNRSWAYDRDDWISIDESV